MLLCDKGAPNGGEMDISGALSPSNTRVSTVAEKQTREFNLAAPSVHRYLGCHLIWAAHQERRPKVHLARKRCLRFWSYKM